MKLQTMIVPCEWKADDGDANTLVGYAATFGNVDLQADVIAQGAFKNTLPRVRAGDVPFLADHMASVRDVLGTLIDAEEDTKGLKIKVRFSDDDESQAVRTKMMGRHIRKMSIGYQPLTWRYETREDERVRVLEEVKLWEVSAVVFPANPEAVIQTVKTAVRNTLDDVVTGAVVNGGDEREIKAAIAEWIKATTDGAAGVVEPPAKPDDKKVSTDTTHLDAGDAGKQEGAEPGTDKGPDSLTLKMRAAEAVLAGRDPDEIADPVKHAGAVTRLDVLDQWIKDSTRKAELTDELDRLRGDR